MIVNSERMDIERYNAVDKGIILELLSNLVNIRIKPHYSYLGFTASCQSAGIIAC